MAGCIALVLALADPTPGAAAEIVGKAQVVDAGTLDVGATRVRLWAVIAPSEADRCLDSDRPWSCGLEASFALADMVGYHWVRCEERERVGDAAVVALCRVGEKDLGRLMVAAGWALAAPGAPTAYAAEEATARDQRRGAWRGEVPSGAVPWHAAGDGVAPGPVPPAGLACVPGTVEAAGVEVGCPEFRGADGRLYALLGATARGLGVGTSACVCGEPAAASICMRGQALVARWAGPLAACAGR